jgi:hypothetical protein
MLRRKIEKSFKVVEGVKNSDFNVFPEISINLIGSMNDREIIVIGPRRRVKYFIKQHRNLIITR